MPNDAKVPPQWLLSELNLTDGVFNSDKTAVTGRPNAHLGAVLNTGSGAAPAVVPVYLTKLNDWEAIKKRLADEGF